MRIYLDNCCYNRPYDDQTQIRISLETQAKIYIQKLVNDARLELVTSYVLDYENSKNRITQKRQAIQDYMNKSGMYYVGVECSENVEKIANPIIESGIKEMDAYHVAAAIYAKCDYFITVDRRVLKYHSDAIELVEPEEFIKRMEEMHHD